ncbi:MAG: hypothetical protein HY722_00230 [Planctomycetes bacterium]|nr:hypothetical protein [Planctomycetota bacterium]
MTDEETALRRRLGIPEDAARACVLAVTAHWDVHWLDTFEGYYRRRVGPTIERALDWLDADPRAVYSVGEVSFLARHWEQRPADRARLQAHARTGRLRMVGGGWTSPDTVLVDGEGLLRDWERGLSWCDRRLGVRPRAAWQPDSFGHAATLPALLSYLGYEAVGLARLDAATAGRLRAERSADFVWEAPDGSRVLAHWMARHYDAGDAVGRRASRAAGAVLALGLSSVDRWLARVGPGRALGRLAAVLGRLEPLGRTPYLFLPFGGDFAPVERRVPDWAEHHNRERYPAQGTWCAVGSFEEYARLVAFHADRLPVFRADPNPYWTGFYATRPEVKRCHALASAQVAVSERLATYDAGPAVEPDTLEPVREALCLLNHHDGITGTCPDRVHRLEQRQPLRRAVERSREELRVRARHAAGRADRRGPGGLAVWVFNPCGFARDETVTVRVHLPSPSGRDLGVVDAAGRPVPSQYVALARHAGGELRFARLRFLAAGLPPLGHRVWWLAPEGLEAGGPRPGSEGALDPWRIRFAPDGGVEVADARTRVPLCSGNHLAAYLDLGGLWRLGCEGLPSTWRLLRGTEGGRARVECDESGPVCLRWRVRGPRGLERRVRLSAGGARVEFETVVAAAHRTTVVAAFRTAGAAGFHRRGVPFAEVSRDGDGGYRPTYWPALGWFAAGGVAFLRPDAAAWRGEADGRVEGLLARNAFWEVAGSYGPWGTDAAPHRFRYAVTRAGATEAMAAAAEAYTLPPVAVVVPAVAGGDLPPVHSWLHVDDPRLRLAALRREGRGWRLRLWRVGDRPVGASVSSTLGGRSEVLPVEAARCVVECAVGGPGCKGGG